MREITHLIVHHSASPRDTTTTKDILQWHRARGFTDIGYHWVIDHMGIIHPGRPWEQIGAHCKGHNRTSLGVCLVGDNTKAGQHWLQRQATALGILYDSLRLLWPKILVTGHRDMPDTKTECPGMSVQTLKDRDWVLVDALL